jgi:hypothetical protein
MPVLAESKGRVFFSSAALWQWQSIALQRSGWRETLCRFRVGVFPRECQGLLGNGRSIAHQRSVCRETLCRFRVGVFPRECQGLRGNGRALPSSASGRALVVARVHRRQWEVLAGANSLLAFEFAVPGELNLFAQYFAL